MRSKIWPPGLCLLMTICILMAGCGESSGGADASLGESAKSSKTETAAQTKGSRDNTPVVLVPEASGEETESNDISVIDSSNSSEGYVMVQYTGDNAKVKLQICGPDGITYTYDLKTDDFEAFPLSAGSGTYSITVYENISDDQYSTCLATDIDADITNEFGPYLYPNKYCYFTADSAAVAKGSELAESADTDLDVVSNVYNYVIDNIKYDYELAENLGSGYIPSPDDTLASGKGICLDFASLMVCMLRSQNIPCQLEVGYAGEAYHAWISVYTEDTGWINGMIEFKGDEWELMDPTFAATSNGNDEELKKFIGDGSNYVVKYIY